MALLLSFPNVLALSISLLPFCSAIDTISPAHTIKDGETLLSSGNIFRLGFFSPGNSSNRYMGIWYNEVPVQTVVWVANREKPLTDSSGVLIIRDGNLAILDGRPRTMWSTNITNTTNYSTATIQDSGNLVLSDNHGKVLWQSFDHPTDTHLPGMRLGVNWRTGLEVFLTSWKSPNDPARGEFSFRLDTRGLPQYTLTKESENIWRSGPWNGQRLSGVPEMNIQFIFNFSYTANEDEIYFTYNIKNRSIISRFVLDSSGTAQRLTWLNTNHRWNMFWSVPGDQCDEYSHCGAYTNCNANKVPVCECLQGFEPKSPQEWYLRVGSQGCVRRRSLKCGKGDGFLKMEHVKVPDTIHAQANKGASLKECEDVCLRNCSCTAYSSADINGKGSGCVMWAGELIDLQSYSEGGQDIYLRLAASELDAVAKNHSRGFRHKNKQMIAIITVILGMILFVICGCCLWRKKKMKGLLDDESPRDIFYRESGVEQNTKAELPLFDLDTIATATKNFSSENKLGEGGFGPVYKGKLLNGQEIAVKRLSTSSGQGKEEFKNEVMLIAKLQHRNLVRILGCCIQGEEKMLIYEYMPNKSLDAYIFDRTRTELLVWRKRFEIIMGIARGVLYLHQDSRLRIIHRDLKASNVLLDDDMNPKISDFGMARIFGGNQTQANTNRVVGTYGYMSPEYAMDGIFSPKSDVFSFGVLLLEIISGKRNNGYFSDDPSQNLIRHTWELWTEGRSLELVDSSLGDVPESEVLRCIHVALLCVQESAEDRPNMASVVFMLSNETTMARPKQPAFCVRRHSIHTDSSTSGTACSNNDLTVTELQAR